MTTIYHNPRCRKSREALEIIQRTGENVKIQEYLKTPPTEQELTDLLKMLGLQPLDIIRRTELIFKENFKDKNYSDQQWIRVMVENPILIQRPIVTRDGRAVVGRPPSEVTKLF